MKTTLRKLAVTVGALGIVAMMTATAHAWCGEMGGKATLKRQAWQRNDFGSPALRLISAADNDPITGMWKTTWTVGTTTIDSAFSLWHADGTEINNSGARAPITGNFCIGIWKNIGKRHYKLNHEGISWDPTGTIEVGVANITQNVVLGPAGDQFEGTFTITQYDLNGDVLQSVSGNIKGVRINIDTVINTL
jgi:hypothetical protein